MTAGEYTMVVLPVSEPFPAPVVLIGGGGDGWDGQGGRSGGAGGRTSATATFKQGNTYKVIVGSSGPEAAPTRFGGPGQNQAPAGGFTGIFYNSVTFANSALIELVAVVDLVVVQKTPFRWWRRWWWHHWWWQWWITNRCWYSNWS